MIIFNRHNWHEPAAYTAAAVCLCAGWLLGRAADPDWMGRAGSIVICIGVLLASSRRIEREEEAIAKHQREYQDGMKPLVESVLREARKRQPSWAEVHLAQAEIASGVPDNLTPMFRRKRRALRMHEVSLVLAGTLINGFGPWVVRSVA